MATVRMQELSQYIGQTVIVNGWVDTVRRQKKMQFLIVRDRTGKVQIAHYRENNPQLAETIESLTPESTIQIEGNVVANSNVKLGGLEIVPIAITVFSIAQTPIPITEESGLDQRLDWRFLNLRDPKVRLVFEIQTTAEQAMREYWTQQGFIEIHSPKLLSAPSESGAELFRVDYFGGNAYLAQSPQFYKQMGIAAGFDAVFEVGPVFRANPSFTSRHDTEFTSIDCEFAWIESHYDVMSMEEQWLAYVLERVGEVHGKAIKEFYDVEIRIPTLPFPKVTIAEAEAIVTSLGYELPVKGDLDPKGERMLAEHIEKTTGHQFVFVTDYPISIRPFYHMRHDDNPLLTKSFDLLFRGLEVTTGAQREHRYDVLVSQVQEKGLSLEPLQFYLDFFKFGCPPHGGYGFGLTRLLMQLLGIANVREVTYVYRGPNRLTP